MKLFYFLLCITFASFGGGRSSSSFTQFSDMTPEYTTPKYTMPKYSDVCDSEIFYHDYRLGSEEFEPMKNSWNSARVNQSACLYHICLYPNGLPVTRKCMFHPYLGAVWEPIANWTRIKCFRVAKQKIITQELNQLHERLLLNQSSFESRDVIQETLSILKKPKFVVLPADVYYTTKILHEVFQNSNDPEISQDVVSIFNIVMSFKEKTLQLSAKLNSTNILLEDFEEYMNSLRYRFVPSSRCKPPSSSTISSTLSKYNDSEIRRVNTVESIDFSYVGIYAQLAINISVFFINPTCANITGIAIYDPIMARSYKNPSVLHKSKGNFLFRFVHSNESATMLLNEPGIQVATFLPEKLWKYVQKQLPTDDQFIIVKVYSHDSIFVQTKEIQTCRPSSQIISISIPKFSGRFPESLPFLVRNNYYDPKNKKTFPPATGCGYWNYETWIRDDVETISLEQTNEPLVLCGTKHLTQFSFLLGGNYRQDDFDNEILLYPVHQQVLDVISVIGCSLSLLGLLGIWISAALFRAWRSLPSTQVLLNICFPLTIMMVLFLFVNTDDISKNLIREKAYIKCIILGAVLQYFLLVLFTWMLLVAVLQFQRYVTIIGIERPNRYILKSAIFAWCFPLLPTLIAALVDPEGYIGSEADGSICYPSGYGLAFGVIFPATVICITNLTIFIYVFYSISNTLNQSMQRQEKLMVVKQIRLSILLFFLLGLCFIFGIFAYMDAGLVFSYLFCLTSTLQGFIFFLYFVVFNEGLRKSWTDLIFSKTKVKHQSKSREMQSITASSAVESGSDRRQ